MVDYGFKISQPGYDVLTATNKQLVFSSKYNTLKVYSQGTGSIPSGQTVTIAHGLAYVPVFSVYSELPTPLFVSGRFFMMPFTYPVGGDISITVYADTTNLYIRYGADIAQTLNYKYTIYVNKGSD